MTHSGGPLPTNTRPRLSVQWMERNSHETCNRRMYIVGGLKTILTFLCWLQRQPGSGCAEEQQPALFAVPLKLSQLVCRIRFEATEGFEKSLQGLFKKTAWQPGQVHVSVPRGADRSLWDSCPATACGRQSLSESEPGLLSSVWNLWHYMTQGSTLPASQTDGVNSRPASALQMLPGTAALISSAAAAPWLITAPDHSTAKWPSTVHQEWPCPPSPLAHGCFNEGLRDQPAWCVRSKQPCSCTHVAWHQKGATAPGKW